MIKYLKNKGYTNIISNNMYVIAEGDLPICLCAHMDTVFGKPPTTFYYDQEQSVLWSPQGLGADDRAGNYAIIELLEKGYRPSIILTDLEEKGGLGAEALINKYPDCPFEECKAIIQLDRQGKNDAVYYECDNKDFEKKITSYGFKTQWGTFTDISIIAPTWKIAAVNLSTGYYNEHQKIETLNTRELDLTIKKVERILKDCNDWPSYAYVPFVYPNDYFLKFQNYCAICNKQIPAEMGHYCYKTDNPFEDLKICENCYNSYCSNN